MNDKKKLHLAFLDLETSGLDPKRHSITEIAIIRVQIEPGEGWLDSWEELEAWEEKVLPEHPYVEPFVARLNGYNVQEWMEKGQRLPNVLTKAYTMLEGSIICGSNPSFDKAFLSDGFEAMGWNFPKLYSHHMIDVPSIASGLLVTGEVEKIRQSTVCKHHKIPGNEHRAMGDARQCMELFRKLLS